MTFPLSLSCYHCRVRKAIILFTFPVFLGTALGAESDWWGLWRLRLARGRTVETVYHLAVSRQSPNSLLQAYSSGGRLVPHEGVEFDPARDSLKLQLTSSQGTQPVVLTLNFRNGQLTGKWIRKGAQFMPSVTGSTTAHRVLRASQWQARPGSRASDPAAVVDISGRLARDAPIDEFTNFENFWNQQIEPANYFLLEHWLYGKTADPIRTKRGKLRGLLNHLQNSRKRKILLESSARAQELLRVGRQFGDSPDSGLYIVNLPGSTQSERLISLGKAGDRELIARVVFFDPLRHGTNSVGRVLSERESIIEILWRKQPTPLATSVYREAVALQMAIESHAIDWPLSAESVAAVRSEFSGSLLTEAQIPNSSDQNHLPRSLSFVLGLAFVRSLRQSHDFDELLALSPQDIHKNWESFLKSGSESK